MMNLGLSLGIGSQRGGVVAAFDPSSLFASSEEGAWYDPSDLSTVWADTSGTTPATVGGAVARIDDKSGNGNHATQATAAARPILRQDGALYYLEFDGVDDRLNAAFALGGEFTHIGGWLSSTAGRDIFGLTNSKGSVRHKTSPVGYEFLNAADNAYIAIAAGDVTASHVINLFREGTGGTFTGRFNGVETTTSAATYDYTVHVEGLSIGSSTTVSAAGALSGRFYDGLWIARELTNEELTNAESYVADKTGVSL